MKKYTSYILIFATIFMLTACTTKKYENVKEKDVFDMNTATRVIESYFNYIKEDNYKELSNLLEEKAKTDAKDIKPSSLKLTGHRISEMTESGGEGDFKIDVIKSNLSKPESQLMEYRIKIKKIGIDYKITEVNTVLTKEVFQRGNQIRVRRDDNVETFLVTNLDGIPKYGYSKKDSGKIQSELVPKNNFGMCSFSYSGGMLGITTNGDGFFAGILLLDDTMETESKGEKKEQQPQEGQKEGVVKEKPIGKQLIACDLLKKSSIENMAFSKDDKLFAIQYKKENNNCLKVFNTEGGNNIPVNFEEEYPLNKVNVIFRQFEKDKMKYSVVSKNSKDNNDKYVGEWELDLKSYKISKSKK